MPRLLNDEELAILRKLCAKIDRDHRMTTHEMIRYCIRWVGVRLNADLIWNEDIRSSKDWNPAEVAMLGKRPDAIVAMAVGRSFAAVKIKRCKLGIPRYKVPDSELPANPPGVTGRADWGWTAVTSGLDYDAIDERRRQG